MTKQDSRYTIPQMPRAVAGPKSVIVGCKLPNGLKLTLKHGDTEESVVLKGCSEYRQVASGRKFVKPDLVYGDSLTIISKEFWDAWVDTHRDFPPLVRGMVYAVSSREDAESRAKDTQDMSTGFEQMDPEQAGLGAKGERP